MDTFELAQKYFADHNYRIIEIDTANQVITLRFQMNTIHFWCSPNDSHFFCLALPNFTDVNEYETEIKKAYRNLIKQYHPDQYGDNPLKDLAQEKLTEINKAYDMIKNGGGSQSRSHSSSYNTNNGYSNSYNNPIAEYAEIRRVGYIATLQCVVNQVERKENL